MKPMMRQIRDCIERQLDKGFQNFIIYPFSETGMQVKAVLNQGYGIKEKCILDRHLCKYNPDIHSPEILGTIDCSQYCVIIAHTDPDVCKELVQTVSGFFPQENIAELVAPIRLNVD